VPQRLAARAVQLAQHHLHAQRLAQLRVLPAAAAPASAPRSCAVPAMFKLSRGAPGEPVRQLELELAVGVLDAADHERGRLGAARRGGRRGAAVARRRRRRARPQARA